MCTVTWWRGAGAGTYGVWFNRDERRTRPASLPVQAQQTADGTLFLAPRDPAAGGTWLLANEHGLVVGVLNFYAATEIARLACLRSRGTLPMSHANRRSVAAVATAMETETLEDLAPFLLLAFDRTTVAQWSWNGQELRRESVVVPPLTTSSYRSAEICAWRRERYAAVVARPDADALAAFHDDVAHPDAAFNVRMRRSDARTESVCRVVVTPREVRFWHRREAADAVAAIDEHEETIACA